MELLELVENEPTSRPFQCDWQSCNKVRISAEDEPTETGANHPNIRALTGSRTYSATTEYIPMSDHTHV